MVGTSQTGTGSSGPQLVMLPKLRGWPDSKEKLVEHCLMDNFPSFTHIFSCPKLSGSAYSAEDRDFGFWSAKYRLKSDLVLRMRSWPSEHMPRCFKRLALRISVKGLIFHSGPAAGAPKASFAWWYT